MYDDDNITNWTEEDAVKEEYIDGCENYRLGNATNVLDKYEFDGERIDRFIVCGIDLWIVAINELQVLELLRLFIYIYMGYCFQSHNSRLPKSRTNAIILSST